MSSDRIFTAPITKMPEIAGGGLLTWEDRTSKNVVANFKCGGLTFVVLDWPGEPPPRENRPPSYHEYIQERMANPPPKRVMPRGVHRGRPRTRPRAAPTEGDVA